MRDWAPELRARLSSLRLSPAREAEIIEELSQHLDDRCRELIAGGIAPDEATRLTFAELKNAGLLARHLAPLRQTQSRDTPPTGEPGPGMWLHGGWRADIRDAWRAVRRTPLQAATIVMSLTIGSTLTVLMFGVVNAMMGGSVPGVRQRDRLVRLAVEQQRDPRVRGLTMGEFRRLPAFVPGLESLGGEAPWRFSANINGRAVATEGMFVSGAYFSVLGTDPALGRLIQPADDRPGTMPVVVIGHEFWQRHLGGDRDALGASIRIGTGVSAVLLSAVGLFALMSYSVSQRTNEFGIRLALGAHPRNITSGVMRESMAVTLAGTALGLVAAIPIASVLGEGVLSSISWRDPVPPAIVAGLLVAVGFVATLAPAWRVSRIDPVRALRQE